MPQLDGIRQGLIERYENGKLKEHGPTSAQRVDLLLPEHFHRSLVEGRFVVLEFFAKLCNLRLKVLHPFHGFHALVSKRDEQDIDDDRKYDDVYAVVVSTGYSDAEKIESRVAEPEEQQDVLQNPGCYR